MSEYYDHRRPAWSRWLLRLIALIALVGVGYGVYLIVEEGTKDEPKEVAIKPALTDLAESQETLGARLESLKPGKSGQPAIRALKAVRRDQIAAVAALRKVQAGSEDVPDERELQDALAAEFDYLDAAGSVLRNKRSPLLKRLPNRAQNAKDAFTALADSEGVEDGIRGTTALVTWAKARA